jgi:hypothetical protein
VIIQSAWCEAPQCKLTSWIAGILGSENEETEIKYLTESEFTDALWKLARISHEVNLAVVREVDKILRAKAERDGEP